MKAHQQHILSKLEERRATNALRELKVNNNLIDFCSNDYLGFAKENAIHKTEAISQFGSTGSRLISGNNARTESVENYLANFYNAPSALLYNSGYTANLGFFSCIPQKGDTVIYDELIHASIRDGIRLSNTKAFSFKHNDPESLVNKLAKAERNVYVVVESIYSMDGDEAPLNTFVELSKKHNFALIVDEAHAVGIYGQGKGLCAALNLEKDVFARVVTFGKAYGCHGAAILGSDSLKQYLINFSRPLIYTTALPIHSVVSIKNAHEFLQSNFDRVISLKKNIEYFQTLVGNSCLSIIQSNSAIQCIIIPGNDHVKKIAEKTQQHGFDVRPILNPTVPAGRERLRICLHSYNTKEEMLKLVETIKE